MTELTAELFQILKDDAVKFLHSICQQILKTQQGPHWKRSVFILIPKKGNAKEWSKHHSIVLISHACKIMLKILQEMGVLEHLICFLRNLYIGQEATVRTEHEQWTGSKLGKESIKAVYCYLAYLTSMQSTSCETLGWMKHKLESRFPGEISITSHMQMIPQKAKRN